MSELFEQVAQIARASAAEHLARQVEGQRARIAELEGALREATQWHRLTEDGSNEAIRAIFGQETLDDLLRWERIAQGR